MYGLQGKVVIVTGAAGGLGASLCRSFALEGCQLFLSDKNEHRLTKIMCELSETGAKVAGEPADLSDTSRTREVIEKAVRSYGRIDTLVNNAGVCSAKSFWELTEADWDTVLAVNVKALFFALQTAARHMRQDGGTIINVASVAGRLPRPSLLPYAASKAAVISITRSAAVALAGDKIRVNAIAPGMMDTPMFHSLRLDLERLSAGSTTGQPSTSAIPLGRIAQPDEIATTALFLASDAAAYITGQTFNVCGGIAMS